MGLCVCIVGACRYHHALSVDKTPPLAADVMPGCMMPVKCTAILQRCCCTLRSILHGYSRNRELWESLHYTLLRNSPSSFGDNSHGPRVSLDMDLWVYGSRKNTLSRQKNIMVPKSITQQTYSKKKRVAISEHFN